MNLYVMRHGTTVWNEKNITQGRSNIWLSRAGRKLTESVAENFKKIVIDAIVCSPLVRTVETANIMNKFHKVKIYKDYLLNEIDQGIFTGRRKDSLNNDEKVLKARRANEVGMETYEQCFNRVERFLKNIKENYPYKNLLVVTHNCCASFIDDIINHKTINFEDAHFLRDFNNDMLNRLSATGLGGLTGSKLEQNVHIDATFPNVTSANEIENALNNLVNVASQRINR